ncbi:MAG TPA: phasin family protein [Thermoanaerobaculia bacterium]
MSQTQMNIGNETGGTIDRLLATGRNLWLAGLGVVAEVEQGGRELFGQLVEKGRPVEEERKKRVEKITGAANQTVRGFTRLVEDTVAYESREMLKRFNVMTRDDVKVLSARLETLSRKIDEYAVRRHHPKAAAPEVVEIVTPQNETAAIVMKANVKAKTPRAKTARTAKATQSVKAATTPKTTKKTAR